MRLIDADALFEELRNIAKSSERDNSKTCTFKDCIKFAENLIYVTPTIDAVPMDFHERCMQAEIKKRIAAEKTNRQILENYVPVVHAHWVKDFIKICNCDWKYKCSKCGKYNKQYSPPYCPHCGARMDMGGQSDG